VDHPVVGCRPELAAQPGHDDLDHITLGVVRGIPDVLGNCPAREHLSGMQREQLEERELFGRQLDGVPRSLDSMARAVDLQVADLDHVLRWGGAAPEESADPRQELLERKRFCQVVVSPGVQPLDLVGQQVFGREDEDGRRDAVSILVEARREDGSPLSEKELRDELLTLLTDGPTSSSLAWVFERLLRHPEKLARLRDELRAGGGEEYLDAVVKETLRLRPPVSVVVRRLLKPAKLDGYDLPAGTLIAPSVYLVHHREDVYERPGEFIPERFLTQRAAVPTWIPFGGGARRCLAASYAEQEIKRVLRVVLDEVDLEPVESDGERISRAAIAFSPSQHGLVVAKPRTPAFA